jgi:hypothetical protein
MAKREVKYKDYRIGRDVYTVKLTHLPQGGFFYNPVVRVQIMKWHLPPRNLWERVTEWWKYNIDTHVWDPTLTEVSLNAYCIDECNLATANRIAVERGDKEWEAF